jgi:hypothetical protein
MGDANGQVVILDNTYPGIKYSEGWATKEIRYPEMNRTSHVATDRGTGFTIEFIGEAMIFCLVSTPLILPHNLRK